MQNQQMKFSMLIRISAFPMDTRKKNLTDNGGEFCKAKLKLFCEENQIELSHGAARTPTIQGLVERSNKTRKGNMRSIIMIWNQITRTLKDGASTQCRVHILLHIHCPSSFPPFINI